MESNSEKDKDICDVAFVQLLKKPKHILNKSQVPTAKQTKESSLLQMKNELQQNYVVCMTEGQKKVNNMKTRLKEKTDLKQTGNVPIILNEWQTLLHEILQGDSNPSIKRVDGAVSLGVASTMQIDPSPQLDLEPSKLNHPVTSSRQNPPTKRPKFQGKAGTDSLGELETDETRKLTTPQLQRLVLLEQLQVLRLKKEKLLRDQGKLQQNITTYVDADGTVFQTL